MSSLGRACCELSRTIRGLKKLHRSQDTDTAEDEDCPESVRCLVTPDPHGLNRCTENPDHHRGSTWNSPCLDVRSAISRVLRSAMHAGRARIFADSTLSKTSGGFETSTKVRARVSEVAGSDLVESMDLWMNERFLSQFFWYFGSTDRRCLASVCRKWKEVLYRNQAYWISLRAVLNYRELRDWSELDRRSFYRNIQRRGFDSVCVFCANDKDVSDLVYHFGAYLGPSVRCLTLRSCNLGDVSLATVMSQATGVRSLELGGCNELTESGLWAALNQRIVCLTISDCINVADESVGAIAQLLPLLRELNLQAYHVTDSAMSLFGARQSSTLVVLRLRSCWEITDRGVLNVTRSLPNLTVLSLSGCGKVTDDAVGILTSNLRRLRSLDLSWCLRVTDLALEFVASDLGSELEELVLDRSGIICNIIIIIILIHL